MRVGQPWIVVPVVLSAVLSSCGGSFSGPGTPSRPPESLEPPPAMPEFGFGDGSGELSDSLGAVVEAFLVLPSSRFSAVIGPSDSIDTDRLGYFGSVDLGDPEAGGVAAGESWMPFLLDNGMVSVNRDGDDPVIEFRIDTLRPILFPTGRITMRVVVRSDADEDVETSVLLELLATDRPSVAFLFEQPPPDEVPLGEEMPRDGEGIFLAGEGRPFALVVRATPNPETGAGFDLDQGAVSLVCDRDLGDPQMGGLPAGEDLGPLIGENMTVIVDPDSGVTISGYRFLVGSALMPAVGRYTFTGFVTDRVGTRSFEQTAILDVLDAVFLEGDVQPVLESSCAVIGCHDNVVQSQGLDLSSAEQTMATAVGVDARQTDEATSCAPLRIEPYAPEASYLLHKILGTHRDGCVGGSGLQMPLGRPPLTDSEIEPLRAWILQGAFHP